MTRYRRVRTQLSNFFPVAVHQCTTRSVFPDKYFVVELFDAALSHNGTRLINLILRRVQILITYLAHVADQVRQKSVFGIKAAMDHDRLELRKFVAVRFNERLLIRRNVVLEQKRSA